MKRLILILICLAGLIMSAEPPGALDMVPPRPAELEAYGTETPLYERYNPDAFTLDYLVSEEQASRSFHLFTNQFLMLKAWLLKMAIRAAEYALAGDLFSPFLEKSGAVMEALRAWLWETDGGPLIIGALALSGLWALLAAFSARLTGALQVLGGTALVLLISLLLLGSASEALPKLQELAKIAARQGADAVAITAQVEDSLTMVKEAGIKAWDPLIYQPWLALEFSDRGMADNYASHGLPGGKFLDLPPSERMKLFYTDSVFNQDDQHNFYWTSDNLLRRRLMALVTFICGTAYALPLLLLAGGILVYQLVLLLVLALLPVWLLLALWWPPGRMELLRRITAVGLGALYRQIVLAITLAVVLVLTLAIPLVLADVGWVFTSMLLGLFSLAAYIYRYAWLPKLKRATWITIDQTKVLLGSNKSGFNLSPAPEREPVNPSFSAEIGLPRFDSVMFLSEASNDARIWQKDSSISASSAQGDFRREMVALRRRLGPEK